MPRSGSTASVTSSGSGSEEPAPGTLEPVQRAHHKGEHIRVFPLSDWTQLDVWQYIADENIDIPPIYFVTSDRLRADGMLMSVNDIRPR